MLRLSVFLFEYCGTLCAAAVVSISPVGGEDGIRDLFQRSTLEDALLAHAAASQPFPRDSCCHYITCHLADTFIQSNLQLIRLSRIYTPWSNVCLAQGPNSCADLIVATSVLYIPI